MKTEMKLSFVFAMFATMLLSGCESYQVITDQDPAVDLSNYNTFTWGSAPPAEVAKPASQAGGALSSSTAAAVSSVITLDVQRLRKVCQEILSSKGYLFVESELADFQVFVASFSELRFQAKPVTPYFGFGHGWHPYSSFEDTTWEPYEGQVYQVDLVDTKKSMVVWSGRVKSRVIEGESVEVKIQLIEKQIATLLKDIPQRSGN